MAFSLFRVQLCFHKKNASEVIMKINFVPFIFTTAEMLSLFWFLMGPVKTNPILQHSVHSHVAAAACRELLSVAQGVQWQKEKAGTGVCLHWFCHWRDHSWMRLTDRVSCEHCLESELRPSHKTHLWVRFSFTDTEMVSSNLSIANTIILHPQKDPTLRYKLLRAETPDLYEFVDSHGTFSKERQKILSSYLGRSRWLYNPSSGITII